MRNALGWAAAAALLPIVWFAGAERALAHSDCARTISAEVVVLDQPLMFNRLGAQNVNGIVYALARDVVDPNGVPITMGGRAEPGRVRLRPDKRPRPLVLRVAAGDCLEVHFQNLLAPQANPNQAPLDALGGIPFRLQIDDQVASRFAGFHPQGMQLVDSIADDGSFVGRNGNSLVPPGGAISYRFFAEHEGTFLVTSHGATFGGEGSTGNSGTGMFAVVNVEPKRADFFRSQVTEEELRLATIGFAPTGQPIIDYFATYPNDCPSGVWCREGKAGLPILRMLGPGDALVHADINAIIVGPNDDGSFPPDTYPVEGRIRRNPTLPQRLEAFREFTVVFHDEAVASQAFPGFYLDPVFEHTLHGVRDAFMINYGSGGIGSEILANRLRVGPMHDCLSCNYEEFFLSSFAAADPAMLVDVPANLGLEQVRPMSAPPPGAVGPKATRAFFPDDPSNVHHAYMGDFVKFRNLHTGKEYHVFHLHNHQWLFNPNDDNASYIDAQTLAPGTGHTYEIAFFGAGNRNRGVGDAIFHCHFYPHFAQGMWELFRVHDVFEAGTRLAVSGDDFHQEPYALRDGMPAEGARALPDGEIVAGTPIPAVVPLPGKPLPPLPGRVEVVPNPNQTTASTFHPEAPGQTVPTGSLASVIDRDVNPGYPFWVAGIEEIVGQRGTTPPLDMLTEEEAAELRGDPLFGGIDLVPLAGGHDGGLPRHALQGFAAGGQAVSIESRLDFSKRIQVARPVFYPETGTDVERTAMAFHAQRLHPSVRVTLRGSVQEASFLTNGRPPVPSGVYADPCVDDAGDPVVAGGRPRFLDADGGLGFTGEVNFGAFNPRVYKAAHFQLDVVFNKVGWHYPQQRIVALWHDVEPLINKQKAPEPFIIRFNTLDCGKYLHTNLIPQDFELDDYQVRTPTDITGQHMHLPKWDTTTTDGAANGWNYEDGTLSPGAVRERIEAINRYNATAPEPVAYFDGRTHFEPEPHPFFGAGRGGEWLGARTTIQRWFFDPIVNAENVERGLSLTFTHDHYGPSTHQQLGLYGSVLTEPIGSVWRHNETGELLGIRDDGGPTSWQAAIITGDIDGDGQDDSFREFFLVHGEFQHAYLKGVYVGAGPDGRPDPRRFPVGPNTFRFSINPSVRAELNPVFPDLFVFPPVCPGGVPRPCPEAISLEDPGMHVVNYRNEPVGLRVFDPNRIGPDGKPGTQAKGEAGDLAFALQTRRDRAIPQLNTVLGDTPYPPLTGGLMPGDPFTPVMRTYASDKVRVRLQIGSHEEPSTTSIHGVKWLHGGSSYGVAKNSGWRNAQHQGLAEQFVLNIPLIPLGTRPAAVADYAYTTNAAQDGWWVGTWGVLRAYNAPRDDLFPLPYTSAPLRVKNAHEFHEACPKKAPVRRYDVTAVLANQALQNDLNVTILPPDLSAFLHEGALVNPFGGTLVYNPRQTRLDNGRSGPLHDPTAILYVHTKDLDSAGRLKKNVPVEPLVLRARAGECVEVTLRNHLPKVAPDLAGYTVLGGIVHRDRFSPQGVTTFNNNLIRPSSYVGLHPQLVAYDITQADGTVVGINPPEQAVVPPGGVKTVRWYVGDIDIEPSQRRRMRAGWGTQWVDLVATPVEFDASNLIPADKVKQGQKGLGGALVFHQGNARWSEDAKSRLSATLGNGERDFTLVAFGHANMRYADGRPVRNIAAEGEGEALDPQDSGQQSLNYGAEPLWFRFGIRPDAPFGNVPGGLGAIQDAWKAFSNQLGDNRDPVTPVFRAHRGKPFRVHLLMPHGNFRGSSFHLHGHIWQRDPYVCPGDADLGLPGRCNPDSVAAQAIGHNPMAIYFATQGGWMPYDHFTVAVDKAGGAFGVKGDYLFHDRASLGNLQGLWGILRVDHAPSAQPPQHGGEPDPDSPPYVKPPRPRPKKIKGGPGKHSLATPVLRPRR